MKDIVVKQEKNEQKKMNSKKKRQLNKTPGHKGRWKQ